jgi:predicted SAM-dependent methyltransferase
MPGMTAQLFAERNCWALKLHLGCGDKILPGWVNIDTVPRPGAASVSMDIGALPYPDASVAEVLAEHVLEHLDFADERRVWTEVSRVLRPGGLFRLEVPDFEWICATFLAARDEWRDFYRVGHPDHYAGCGRDLKLRWGILQTMFFGNQNGAGQYHRTAYTCAKLHAIAARTGFKVVSLEAVFNKGGQALGAVLERKPA